MYKGISVPILGFFVYFFLKLSSRYHTDSLPISHCTFIFDFTKGSIALTCPNMLSPDIKTFRVSNEGRVHNAGVEILCMISLKKSK